MLDQVKRYFDIAYRFNYLGAQSATVRALAVSDFLALYNSTTSDPLRRAISRYLATAHNHPVIAPSTG